MAAPAAVGRSRLPGAKSPEASVPEAKALESKAPEGPSRYQGRVLVIACGALARELGWVMAANRLDAIDVEYLPAILHNRPERIAGAVRDRLRRVREAGGAHGTVLVGYMGCGLAELDRLCAREGLERLPGAHCYELYAGPEVFEGLHQDEPGSFYLTDYLVRHFDRLIIEGLGIAEHPELLGAYFGNYARVVHLAQADDPDLDRRARRAAQRLGLGHHRVLTGCGGLEQPLIELHRRAAAGPDARTRPTPAGAP